MDEYIKLFNAPIECCEGKKIPKKLFYEEGNLTAADKEIFTTNIKKIVLEYMFSEERINIKPYRDEEVECEEIAVIRVILESDKKYKRICDIIQKAIPYSIILICEFDSNVIFNVANKKINKVDDDKNVIDEMLFTEWIKLDSNIEADNKFFKELNIKGWYYIDLYKFYNSCVDKIKIYNASKYSDNIETLNSLDVNLVKETTDKIEMLTLEIDNLRKNLKKEVQFNKKIEINIKIKKIEQEKKKLILSLKGE
ncbi:DUF4391 domain-containing protein [Clostridium tertium]|uniref:DUF4391 domain-containing protein n=1 Tax=Clostridium tertium TaxID=1559 RepID=UPI0018AAD9B5|nr:DUF4391 domain-containing protein [Clostridium tertium]